jgi:hypothetical protein
LRYGGVWYNTGPSLSDRLAATERKYETSVATSARRLWCVMRCGALSAKVKPGGVSSAQRSSIVAAGIR